MAGGSRACDWRWGVKRRRDSKYRSTTWRRTDGRSARSGRPMRGVDASTGYGGWRKRGWLPGALDSASALREHISSPRARLLEATALANLRAMSGDDPQFVAQLIAAFLEDAPAPLRQLRKTVDAAISGCSAPTKRPATRSVGEPTLATVGAV